MRAAPSPSRVVLAALAVVTACGFGLGLGDGKRRRQCDALVARVAATALPAAPPEFAPRFRAEQLHIEKWHPHSGPICYYAGFVPEGWTLAVLDDPRSEPMYRWTGPDGATLSYALSSVQGPHEEWSAGYETVPARAREQVQRERYTVGIGSGRRRHVVVALADGKLWLRVIHWTDRDDGHFYFRCEASLAPAHAAALPLFEAVCDAVLVRHFEYPPW